MKQPAPFRFLAAVVGGWVAFRLVVLLPGWTGNAEEMPEGVPSAQPASRAEEQPLPGSPPATAGIFRRAHAERSSESVFGPRLRLADQPTARAARRPVAFSFSTSLARAPFAASAPSAVTQVTRPIAAPPFAPSPPALQAPERAASRWSGSAWMFVREGSGVGLAPGGTLGASQAGARLAYRVGGGSSRPLALSSRVYSPLERPQGAEAALGLDWQPIARLPLHILAERRERLGREGRSDFSLTVYGGIDRRLARGRLRVEAYGQAGVVGIEERDLFADGSARVSVPLGRAQAGAGLWGGAQPGVSRLDAGPQVSAQFSIGRVNLRADADWRFRIAGGAAPGSGPTLTISAGF